MRIFRVLTFVLISVISIIGMEARIHGVVVADSATRVPLPNASIYDRSGSPLGISTRAGVMPKISAEHYPITIRYVGFHDRVVPTPGADTIFLREEISVLQDFTIESGRHKVLHILGYVREYSTMTTYTDTVFLFREKMVDYMLTPDAKVRFKGWTTPRVLSSRSYYRFRDATGRDSVSDASPHHFSWADWVGIPVDMAVPEKLKGNKMGTDTIRGKYSPAEIWKKDIERIVVDIDVLADTAGRKWVPNLAAFFRKDFDFERFKVSFDYDNIVDGAVTPLDLNGYSFKIESNGRGREMFRFNNHNEPFFVTTDAEVYILDKEYITVKEAKKWANRNFTYDEIGIYEPLNAPELDSATQGLIARVGQVDKGQVRLDVEPDQKLVSQNLSGRNFKIGRRVLSILKDMTGITSYKFRKNFKRKWHEFRRDRTKSNSNRSSEDTR